MISQEEKRNRRTMMNMRKYVPKKSPEDVNIKKRKIRVQRKQREK